MKLLRVACNFFKNFRPLRLIGRKFLNSHIEIAAKYYQYKPEEIAASSIGISAILAVVFFSLIFIVNLLLAIIVSFSIAYFSSTYVLNYLPNKLRTERYTIAKYASLILEELNFILSVTGSIFDALFIIGNAHYPHVSEKFRNILFQSYNGGDPEELLLDYAREQPSKAFNRGLTEVLFTHAFTSKILRSMIDFSDQEIRGYFQEFTFELEGRALLFLGLTFFILLIIAFAVAVFYFTSSTLFFLIIPIHLIFCEYLSRRLISSEVELLGGHD